MTPNPLLSFLAVPILAFGGNAFQDTSMPSEQRIDAVISQMTVEEKIACLARKPAVPRLGVPGSPIMEGYHGLAQGGPSNWGRVNPTPTTQFPQAYGLGATWEPEILFRIGEQSGIEGRYLYQNPEYKRAALILLAPNADLARDPRWGRTEESFGEDPFLTGTLATSFVKGLQGDHPEYVRVASLLKHFLANSNEDEREFGSSNFDERQWREYYAKPFEMAVVQGGARCMMAAYNAINGTPAHIHPMLREIVMKEWGFDGVLCSDGGGMTLLVTGHKRFETKAEAVAACLKAGLNYFLDDHVEATHEALKKGLLTEMDLDEALRGLFRTSIRLGLWDPADDNPYAQIGLAGEKAPWTKPETKAFVREVTRKSIVLLRNEGALLPLNRDKLKSIAVVGPYADAVIPDWYGGTPPYVHSIRDGIERAVPLGGPNAVEVNWVADMSDTAVKVAAERDVAVVVVGNHPESNAGWAVVTAPQEGKEAVDRKDIVLQPAQEEFIRKVVSANPRTVVVLVSSFPYAMPWASQHAPAILHMTHSSQEMGTGLADVLFGDYNPGGKLTQTWPKSVSQLPPANEFDLRKGHTYLYSKAEPQYPFGFGLSYTTFKFDSLTVSSERLSKGGVQVKVRLTNTGTRPGDEVVQLYVRHLDSQVYRPLRELKAFKRISVDAGASQEVTLSLRPEDVAYWEPATKSWTVEAGRIELLVGNSSAEKDLTLRQVLSVSP
ncbi:MAG: glycoside hydrolase family 3 C-terminal domain-containing protein [Opitutaceae bacterium]|nr:glycoside hydrolase family 3 C-terminal domain-containing protein [Opitutaceae bacterium]